MIPKVVEAILFVRFSGEFWQNGNKNLRLGNEGENAVNAEVEVDEQKLENSVDLGKQAENDEEAKLEGNGRADLGEELRDIKEQWSKSEVKLESSQTNGESSSNASNNAGLGFNGDHHARAYLEQLVAASLENYDESLRGDGEFIN